MLSGLRKDGLTTLGTAIADVSDMVEAHGDESKLKLAVSRVKDNLPSDAISIVRDNLLLLALILL